ncbi:MAG: hypothetical protein NC411_02805 [Bacteroides sp.]|nr:hypothetical protein [Bacteroides sp.]
MDDIMSLVDEFSDILGSRQEMPLATYEVEIVEVRKKTVKVEMPIGSYKKAQAEVYRRYIDGEVKLMPDDITEVEVNVGEITYQDEEL